ncbi:MAG: alpha/beta hydrolase [Betaproteobacteria bacterium]|nr:alpha/beta hydrolase [Betaproteobacteria bacterium]
MTFRGHNIFVRESRLHAQRPVLLMVHGFPTASWDWSPVWDELARDFHLVTFDLLGFGFSAKPRGHRYTILEQADLAEAVLADCGVERFHVLAHDYGDTVAQDLLARDVERAVPRILSATLLNGGLFPETHRPRLTQKLLLTPLGPLIGRLNHRRAFGRAMTAIFGPRTPPKVSELDALWTLLIENDGKAAMHRLIQYIPERRKYRERWVGALVNARCPLALINGSADPVSGAHMVARWREVVGKGTIVEMPEIGHYPQIEAPHAVLMHFRAFMAGIRN